MGLTTTLPLPGGGQLNTRIDGPEGAPWVVLSNSVLTDLRIWDGQIAALAQDHRVLRYDQRGHGGSSPPQGAMDFAGYGADLLAVLAHHQVNRCAFVGLSMGVPTGLAALVQAPERFAAFVAVDGVAASAPGREAFWHERRETAEREGMAEIARSTQPRWLSGVTDDSAPAQALRKMIKATPTAGFAAATHALASYDQSAALPHLTMPFLGLAGELDGAMPEAMRRQFAALPKAQFALIPGAGHLPNFQAPEAFSASLLGFLTAQRSDIFPEILKENL